MQFQSVSLVWPEALLGHSIQSNFWPGCRVSAPMSSIDANELLRGRGNPVVLLVEEKVLVRMLLADFLRKCGLIVIEAATAGEALAALRSNIPVDVVFAGHQSSGGGEGFLLAQWSRTHRPGLKILRTVGVRRKVAEAASLCEKWGTTVPKPFSPPDLERAIQRLLASQ